MSSASAPKLKDLYPVIARVKKGALVKRFSKWNEPVHVTAPTQAVPVATVRRS